MCISLSSDPSYANVMPHFLKPRIQVVFLSSFGIGLQSGRTEPLAI